MSSKTIFMGTTQISPQKTAMEIQSELQRAKVQEISSEYAPNGDIIALRFCQRTPTGEACWYRLPIRWEACKAAMRRLSPRTRVDDAQAKRVAWRQVLRWVQAQLALIEMQQTTAFEVFLPYMHVDEKRTVAELFSEQKGVPLLPPGTDKP